MGTLKGENIYLRALEPSDLDFLFHLENEEKLWEVSNTIAPYSRFVLNEYLEHGHRDIYEVKQLRLVICLNESDDPIGFIDLYDFDPRNSRVGVGIVIFPEGFRGKGFSSEALGIICDYAFKYLKVHQVFAGITEDNKASISLFETAGFKRNGIKMDWTYSQGRFKNEYLYQLIRAEP